MLGGAGKQKAVVLRAAHFISKFNYARTRPFHSGTNQDLVIEAGGTQIPAIGLDDRQKHVIFAFHIAVPEADGATKFNAGHLHPDKVISVVHNSHLVGFGVTDANAREVFLHARQYSGREPSSLASRLLDLRTVTLVKVLFFGSLREIAGASEDMLDVSTLPQPATLASVFEHYAACFPRLRDLRSSIVLARDRQFSSPGTLVAGAEEIAMLPPVSGGAFFASGAGISGNYYALTREPIDSAALARHVAAGSDGAVVTFEGIVRDNTKGRRTVYLDYEGYEPMALTVMEELGTRIAATYAIGRIAIVHRLGRMEIGEASVAIVVSAPHRHPAFEASLEAIDSLKRSVPIWKKEYFEDGEVWVEGEWDAHVRAQSL